MQKLPIYIFVNPVIHAARYLDVSIGTCRAAMLKAFNAHKEDKLLFKERHSFSSLEADKAKLLMQYFLGFFDRFSKHYAFKSIDHRDASRLIKERLEFLYHF